MKRTYGSVRGAQGNLCPYRDGRSSFSHKKTVRPLAATWLRPEAAL
jgi:hypothetical protein